MEDIKVCGVVCEYNPLHKGHVYQIREAKARSGAEFVIAVMSGNFVQRGEIAILDKWARTEMALRSGVDLVIELPTPFAVASAEFFAYGAMNALEKTGIVTHISFGSESFDGENGAKEILKIAENDVVVDKMLLKKGLSYAAVTRNEGIESPNDLLGIEYIRAARKMRFKPQIVPIKRMGSIHDLKGSAKYIRNILMRSYNNEKDIAWDEIVEYAPEQSIEILKREINECRGPVYIKNIEKIILADLRRKNPEMLKKCPFVSEGIEYKIHSEALKNFTFENLIKACTSKRYTSSRIRRIILSAVLGIDKDILKKEVPYLRILGMNKKAGKLMKMIKEKSKVPIVTSKIDFIKGVEKGNYSKQEEINEIIKIENNASEIYSLAYPGEDRRLGASELTHPLVFL